MAAPLKPIFTLDHQNFYFPQGADNNQGHTILDYDRYIDTLDPRFRQYMDEGILTPRTVMSGGDDPKESLHWDIDWERMPKLQNGQTMNSLVNDKFGTWVPINDVNEAINRDYAFEDPNYGWVTGSGNVKEKKQLLNKIMKGVTLSIIGGGLGSIAGGLAGGGLMGSLASGAAQAGLGSAVSGRFDPKGFLTGMVSGAVSPYIPAPVRTAIGAYQAVKNPVGAGMGLARSLLPTLMGGGKAAMADAQPQQQNRGQQIMKHAMQPGVRYGQ